MRLGPDLGQTWARLALQLSVLYAYAYAHAMTDNLEHNLSLCLLSLGSVMARYARAQLAVTFQCPDQGQEGLQTVRRGVLVLGIVRYS